MAQEYTFYVNTDDDKGVPFGPVNKDNLDISRLIIDFTDWLNGSDSLYQIDHLTILANPATPLPPWQANYPLDETSATPPTDTYPLLFYDSRVGNNGRTVELEVQAGTPGLSYAVSFTATGGISRRRREVDVLMVIDRPLNPAMVSVGDPPSPVPTYPLIINATTALAAGFKGRAYIENTSAAPITVTLPANPALGDTVSFLDVNFTNATWPVTFLGHASAPFIGSPISGYTGWVSNVKGDDVQFEWTGAYWAQVSKFAPMLGYT